MMDQPQRREERSQDQTVEQDKPSWGGAMKIITPSTEAKEQHRQRLNVEHARANRDALDHLMRIRMASRMCDPQGNRIAVDREPWDWVETDHYGDTHGANIRKEVAIHESGHCVSAFVLGSYPTEARLFKSRGAKRYGTFDSLSTIHGYSTEEVRRSIADMGFTRDQALLAASCQVIELCAGVASAVHVGGLIHADKRGFNDDWKTRNILGVFPELDEDELRSLAATLVVYYEGAVKAVAIRLFEESQLFTEGLLSAAVDGFGPEFRIHPRNRWALKHGPYGNELG